jgi:hypothetical protein
VMSRTKKLLGSVVVFGTAVLMFAREAPAADKGSGEEEFLSETRLRVGASAFGGAFLGPIERGGGGISGRLGAQFGRRYAAYAQPLFMVADPTLLGGTGAIFEMTFLDSIYLGGGPEVLYGRIRRSSYDYITQRTIVRGDKTYVAFTLRAGVVFGDVSPTRRTGFSIGLDLRVIAQDDALYTPFITFGFEAF